MRRLPWILAVPALAIAQIGNVEMTAPTIGYVFDRESRGLRPIEGVPGAAILGNLVALGVPLDWASVSPNRRYAIAGVAGSGQLMLVKLDGAVGVARQTEMGLAEIAFSPAGETMALMAASRVEVWTGLPNAPQKRGELALGELSGRIDKLAISDDGAAAVALSGGELWRLTEQEPQLLGAGYSDLVFLRSSHDLIATQRAEGRVVLFRKTTGEIETEEMAGATQGIEKPVALALSADQRRLAVLNQDRVVVLVERESLTARRLPLDNVPAEGIWRVQGNAVFQFTGNGSEQIWLLDGDAGEPRLVSVARRGEQ
ncbi:MAG: hypothetical protein HY235_30550 [Acidobacteria bacterium]|nr:hypothetical protein [Acidobacteriota bacterium]